MNKIRIAQLILLAGFILLIINLSQLDFNNLLHDKGIVMGIISNALLIVGMVFSIKELKKPKNQ
jgi:hypothetical protein